MLSELILKALSECLQEPAARARPVSGGDINDAFEVELASGSRVFVKTHAAAPAGLYLAEARGLEWLRTANCLNVPEVLCVSDGTPSFLALRYLRPAPRISSFDEQLGRGLAALHCVGAPQFGFEHDNFIGLLPQANPLMTDWADFYLNARLGPQFRAAVDAARLPQPLIRNFNKVLARLSELVGPDEPPARLHGDLWGGNLMVDEHGRPALIDPAVYGGHREMDLAMMRLFGGFSSRTFDAYCEAYPLSYGAHERVPLYQLYPLLIHVNLFGGSYVGQLARALSALQL